MDGDRVVDLNDGSEEELSDLPMVGKQRARDLIAIDLFLIGR
jgi:DNA uptake protein ComE-like DNA-binding protein